MVTLERFIEKNIGRYVDYDKHWGFQCMDLMREYIIDCLGLTPYQVIPPVNYAKNAFYNYKGKEFTKIKNARYNFPKKGDIIFWGTYPFVTGIAGHVAIVVSADVNNIVVFNQNYPTGSPCLIRRFNYRGIIGWLSPKK